MTMSPRVVERGVEVGKFTQCDEQRGPGGELRDVSREQDQQYDADGPRVRADAVTETASREFSHEITDQQDHGHYLNAHVGHDHNAAHKQSY